MKDRAQVLRRLALVALMAVVVGSWAMATSADVPVRRSSVFVQVDTAGRGLMRSHAEEPSPRMKMVSSPLPVEIRQQGRHLCVKSEHDQLLPVYTVQGTFYSAFRLLKGTNWINGLPRGTYYINHRKYTIS